MSRVHVFGLYLEGIFFIVELEYYEINLFIYSIIHRLCISMKKRCCPTGRTICLKVVSLKLPKAVSQSIVFYSLLNTFSCVNYHL